MPNAEKVEKVEALAERIKGSQALLLTEYRGLSVHDATELRRSLADQARFAVVKNTLMARAATDAGIEDLGSLLEGPTAAVFVSGDPVAAAKKVVDAARRVPSLILKGAFMEGRVLDAAEAQSLATLESREVMLSKVAGMLRSEMSRAAAMFQALQGRFLALLEAYKEKVPAGEAPEAAEREAPAAEAPAEPEAQAEATPPAEAAETSETTGSTETTESTEGEE
jgi:large subunit ribosomal protein L10